MSLCIAAASMPLTPLDSEASYYRYADGFSGAIGRYMIQRDESLPEIARAFGIGFNSITTANGDIDPFAPVPGTTIVLPDAWILPEVPYYDGIVINLAELRLYLFDPGDFRHFWSFPIGIGDFGSETPTGLFTISEKITDPTWHVPPSIRAENPFLPEKVPPGPDNPLGKHALRLSHPSILIHGTNRPWSIGTRSSHGCLRLYPEDIRELFQHVQPGTRVMIIRQPVKVSTRGGRVFLQVHRCESYRIHEETQKILSEKGLQWRVNPVKLRRALQEQNGIPVDVTGKDWHQTD